MRLASRTAAGAAFPVLDAVREALKAAEARGMGDEDFSALIKLL
jgi:3-hydroxyisobutyrate dehydrogenase-like beta-hydroxyacid dehydrogenase